MMLSISIIITVIISCIHIVNTANDNGRYDFAHIVSISIISDSVQV